MTNEKEVSKVSQVESDKVEGIVRAYCDTVIGWVNDYPSSYDKFDNHVSNCFKCQQWQKATIKFWELKR